MAIVSCRRARRVSGAPGGVVAWIDHELHGDLLFLNAACFTAQDEKALTTALVQGSWTSLQVLNALLTTGG